VEIDDELQLTFTDGHVQAKVLAKIGKGDG